MNDRHDPRAEPAIPMLAAMTPPDRAAFLGAMRTMRLPARAILMTTAQPGEALYIVSEGSLRVEVEREDGALVILAFLGPGDAVGEMASVEGAERSATVVALEPSTLWWMDRVAFDAALASSPGLAKGVSAVLARRLRQANAHILALSALDVGARVARQLASLAAEHGVPAPDGGTRIELRLSQSDLAAVVGASREQVNRTMAGLRRAGIIRLDEAHRVVVLDAAALARRAR